MAAETPRKEIAMDFPELGFREVIDEMIRDKRLAWEKANPDLVPVIRVVSYPQSNGAMVVGAILLRDSTSHVLKRDEFGQRNYILATDMEMTGDELYCIVPSQHGSKLVLVGSQKGTARIE